MRRIHRLCAAAMLALLAIAGGSGPAAAVLPDEVLSDPSLEARARDISRDLRCLVCQNQSIDDSNADLARDMRILVRERLVAGDSDEEVIGFVRDRYGDFVLLKPPVTPGTYALWFGPAVLLILALAGGFAYLRGRSPVNAVAAETTSPALSDEEQERVRRLAAEVDDGRGGAA